MKKYIILLIFSFMLVSNVKCLENEFNIDVNKININDKGNSLINSLNKTYEIDTTGFSKVDQDDEKAKEYTKKLIDLALGDGKYDVRLKDILNEGYISEEDGFQTLTANMTIQSFMEEIHDLKISYDYIKLIRTFNFEDGIISYVYIPKAMVSGKENDLILTFYLKDIKGSYRLYIPWYTTGNNLEDYFKKLAREEDNGDNVGNAYNSISLDDKKGLSDEQLKKFYDNYYKQSISLTGMKDNAVSVFGSGFFIRKGVVVTTWSLFLQCLNNSDFIYVNDALGNTQLIDGVIAADTNYDIVVLKLKEEIGESVSFGDSLKLKANDYLLTIDSKNNNNFSVNYGNFITLDEGRIKNLFALTEQDVGSALYNLEGQVVAFNTANILNSNVSIANSTNYLKKLQNLLTKEKFENIKVSDISTFKEKYYYDYQKEVVNNTIDSKIWDKYNKIGNIKKNIKLDLVKSSYTDNILSLRYKNKISNSIDTMYLISDYENELIKDNFKLTYDESNKKVYNRDDYKVIIKKSLDYLVIIIVEN